MTSIFAGFVVFPYIGYLSKLTGQEIENVLEDNADLAYIIFPYAVTTLRFSSFWSIIFFIMLFSVGLDTMMGSVETTVTAIVDTFPKLYNSSVSVSIFVCFSYFLLGLMYCGQNGIYWICLFDTFCGSKTLTFTKLMCYRLLILIFYKGWGVLMIAFFECISISWCYGNF